jgi:signal transduction histidine kinase
VVLIVGSTVVPVAVAIAGVVRWSRSAAAAAFAVSAAVTAFYPGPGNDAVAAWLLVETVGQLVVLVRVTRRMPALAPLGVVAVGVSPLRIGLWLTPPSPAIEVVGVCAVWTLLAAAAVGVGAYLRALDRARARAVVTARAEQRLHLARDLHDWLAHEMTSIVLAAQAGQVDGTDPTPTFRQIEEAGVRGLDAMDRALRLLRVAGERPVATATMADVRAVVDRFATSSGADVTCEVEVPEPRPEITATVHRVVVESLTNIRRHARAATAVRVRVAREGDDVVVEVTDNSPSPARRTRRGGTGLAGLRDWVSALDGTLTAGAARPGWRVRAVLPT